MDPDEDDVWILGWGADAAIRLGGAPVAAFAAYTGALE